MSVIGFIDNWEQAVTWFVLFMVLYSIVSGKFRYDVIAFGGLLVLGIVGIIEPRQLFSGFSSPAIFTITSVLVMSAGIVESGLLTGFGKKIASRMHQYKNQIFALFLTAGFISAFMNNVGSVGIILPTAKRMAQRAKVPHSTFGIPIAFASILGGSLTLIGTASNLIVSTYRLDAIGEPFKMFDFLLHGLAILLSGIFILFLCRVCGFHPLGKVRTISEREVADIKNATAEAIPRNRRKSIIVFASLVPIVAITSIGLVHPAAAFGGVTLIWILTGVLPYKTALDHINVPIIVFLGSMFGISAALEETGALDNAVGLISPILVSLSPFLLILIFLFVTALFANILNNSIAAVIMAPVAVALWRSGAASFNLDALLMAVAAGASMGIVIPTHQVTIVVMNSMNFPRKSFIKTGAAIAAIAGISSAFVIYAIWR